MIIITKKIHPARLAAGLAVLALAAGFLTAGTGLAREIRSVQAAAETAVDPRGIRSNEDRIAYLERWGWVPGPEPVSVEEVLIPEHFDDSYAEYLALQSDQGFDLRPYAGKKAKRYTYQITNYPGLKEDIWASLLICRKTVIAGEIYSPQGDGFTQGLAYPAKS